MHASSLDQSNFSPSVKMLTGTWFFHTASQGNHSEVGTESKKIPYKIPKVILRLILKKTFLTVVGFSKISAELHQYGIELNNF